MMATRRPRYSRVVKPPKFKIGRPKHAILAAVGRYRYLTAPQLTKLISGKKVLKYYMEHASDLYQGNYLERISPPVEGDKGSSLFHYCLTQKGYDYLKGEGLEPEGRFKQTEERDRGGQFLKHNQQCNDLMILAHALTRVDPRITVRRMMTEGELRLSNLSAIPDGWIQLSANRSASIAFELDRDTTQRRDWHKKIDGYTKALKGEYQNFFDSRSLTIAVVAPSQRRVRELIDWTESYLKPQSDQSLAQYILFACFDGASANPLEIFLAPYWEGLFSSQLHPLLVDDLFREAPRTSER